MADGNVTVIEAAPRSVAGIGAFGKSESLRAAIRAAFGVELPAAPRCVQAGAVAWSCLAPGRFLASGVRNAGLPVLLSKTLAGLAAVTDQSDMWAVFVVSGAAAHEILSRVVPVDLGDEQFRECDLALTRASHLDVRLCRVSAQVYEIATTRSLAPDLNYALAQANH